MPFCASSCGQVCHFISPRALLNYGSDVFFVHKESDRNLLNLAASGSDDDGSGEDTFSVLREEMKSEPEFKARYKEALEHKDADGRDAFLM